MESWLVPLSIILSNFHEIFSRFEWAASRCQDPRLCLGMALYWEAVQWPLAVSMCIHSLTCNLSRNSFYKQHVRGGHVCLMGGVNHAQRRMNKPLTAALVIVGEETLLQSWVSAWCASVTHFTLGLRSVCQRNFCLDYSSNDCRPNLRCRDLGLQLMNYHCARGGSLSTWLTKHPCTHKV